MILARQSIALAFALSLAPIASACPTTNRGDNTTAIALAAPVVVTPVADAVSVGSVVITEPFAVPVATFLQPQALVTPTVITPTIVTPTIATPTIVQAVPQTVVVKEVARHPRPRVQVTRTVTRSRR